MTEAGSLVGATLGHYRITGRLGAGGMGEVYRDQDSTLGRDVAIKVVPESFASDPEGVARLEGEARLLAALNHSHIAQVYGFEEHEGARFLGLELLSMGDPPEEGASSSPLTSSGSTNRAERLSPAPDGVAMQASVS